MRYHKFNRFLCWGMFFCAFLANLHFGASQITLDKLILSMWYLWDNKIIPADVQLMFDVVWLIRLPRICAAAICGACLAGAGVITQAIFRNSLASPTVLGVSAGGTALAAIIFYTQIFTVNWLFLPLGAFIGTMLTSFFLLLLASRLMVWSMDTLLLCGFALNAMLSAITTFITTLSLKDHEQTNALMHWLLGSFTAKGWEHLYLLTIPIVLAIILSYYLMPFLDVFILGEETATSLGVPLNRIKILSIVAVSLFTAAAISIGGGISFVGLIIPHSTRYLVGSQNKRLFIYSLINGATLLLFADLLSRNLTPPAEIQVGVFTAMLGGVFFLALLLRSHLLFKHLR